MNTTSKYDDDISFLIEKIREVISLDQNDEKYISELFERKSFKKNELIIKEGKICQNLYFIVKGMIRFSIFINGKEKIIVFKDSGSFFTDLESLLLQNPSRFSITAVEPTSILYITNSNLQIFYKKINNGERFGRINMQEIFLLVVSQLTTIYSESPEQRYTNFLKEYKHLIQRIPQYQIASYIGVTPQALCRIKKKFLKQNL